MRLTLSFLILLSFCIPVSGQNIEDTIFYSSDWRITSREFASYYRITDFNIHKKCFLGVVSDYTINSDKLIMRGHYANCQRNGIFSLYTDSGDSLNLNFKNGDKTGIWSKFDSAGNLTKQCKYSSHIEKIIYFSNQAKNSNVLDGNGYFIEERFYAPFNKKYTIEGEIIDSLKNGKWIIRNSENKIVSVERYKNGLFITSKVNMANNEYDPAFLAQEFTIINIPEKLNNTESLLVERGVKIKQNKVLIALKEMTEQSRGIIKNSNIISGFAGLEEFLDEKILLNSYEASNYPEDDTIIIQFIQNTDYTLRDISLLKPTYSDPLNTEIINVLESINKIELEEPLAKPRRIKFIYRLKFPMELPIPILE